MARRIPRPAPKRESTLLRETNGGLGFPFQPYDGGLDRLGSGVAHIRSSQEECRAVYTESLLPVTIAGAVNAFWNVVRFGDPYLFYCRGWTKGTLRARVNCATSFTSNEKDGDRLICRPRMNVSTVGWLRRGISAALQS
jgi:hypothetical protein